MNPAVEDYAAYVRNPDSTALEASIEDVEGPRPSPLLRVFALCLSETSSGSDLLLMPQWTPGLDYIQHASAHSLCAVTWKMC